jgi:hypothetical protein
LLIVRDREGARLHDRSIMCLEVTAGGLRESGFHRDSREGPPGEWKAPQVYSDRLQKPFHQGSTAHELASAMTPEQSRRYSALVQAVTAQTASHTTSGSGLPADAAAKVIAKAVTARKPRTRYTVGRDAALLILLARILPDRILDRVFAAALRPHFPKESK